VEEGDSKPELALVKTWLVDTGPIVAYLDATDPDHTRVSSCLEPFTGRLATTSAVVTEAMHLLAPAPGGPRALAEFFEDSRIEVYDFSHPPELHAAVSLMEKYRDTPMDFADATLLLLADATGARDIITLDRRGFSIFRTRTRKALRMILGA
jgi:hypothetical protein